MELEFYIKGKLVPNPINYKEILIELLFTADRPSASISSTTLEWVGENATTINNEIRAGLTGGVGIYEGVPLQIKTCGSTLLIFDGVIDCQDAGALFECDIVKAPIKKTGGIDFVNDRAQSFSFAYLASLNSSSPGYISVNDYLKVPFTITTHRTSFEKISMILSGYVIAKELLETAKRTKELINQIVADIAGIATATSTLYAIAKLAAMILNVILFLLYIVALLAALINMVLQLVDLVYPPKRYKLAMKVKTLFQKGMDNLGITFSSTIFANGATYENFIYMPRKNTMPISSNPLKAFNRGYNEVNSPKAYGYPDMTFKEFIIEMQDYFNASIKIINNVAHFERVDYWNSQSVIQLPNIGNVGYTFNYPDPHGTNASELPANYMLIYSLDIEDINTFQRYEGTSYQVHVSPKVVNNKQNLLLTNFKEVRFNFSLAKRKDYMNEVEAEINYVINGLKGLINGVYTLVKKLTNIAKKGTYSNPNAPLLLKNNRIGWLEIASPFTSNPKVFVGQYDATDGSWIISKNNQTLTSAQTIFESFHRCNLATIDPVTKKHGQYLTFKNKVMPLCCTDYIKVSNRNIFKTADNKVGKFYRVLWNPHKETADIDYGINELFTTNLTESVTIDGSK